MEIIFTGFGSLASGDMRLYGYTNLWMFPIYGAAVFLEPLHDIMAKWRWPVRGVIWVIIIWGVEYTSGFLIVNMLGIHPWQYNSPLAIDGLVNLAFAPAWFAAGLIFEQAHKLMDAYSIA